MAAVLFAITVTGISATTGTVPASPCTAPTMVERCR